jgi:hypothetical protein
MIDCDVFCTVYLFHTPRGRYQFDNRCDMIGDVMPPINMNVLDLIILLARSQHEGWKSSLVIYYKINMP